MRPSDMRMSAFSRPSGRTSVPPRTTVSITMSEFQVAEKSDSSLERGSHVGNADVLSRVVADAAFTAEEYHADGHLRGKHHGVVARAAGHSMKWSPGVLERAVEHRRKSRIHRH